MAPVSTSTANGTAELPIKDLSISARSLIEPISLRWHLRPCALGHHRDHFVREHADRRLTNRSRNTVGGIGDDEIIEADVLQLANPGSDRFRRADEVLVQERSEIGRIAHFLQRREHPAELLITGNVVPGTRIRLIVLDLEA